MKTVGRDELSEFRPDFLIVTTADIERETVLSRLQSTSEALPGTYKVPFHEDTYYVGRIGLYTCVVVQTDQSSDGRAGAHQTVNDGIERWNPNAVIAVGIAFGCKPASQVLGDVLFSTKLYPYDHKKVTPNSTEQRASSPDAGLILGNRLKNSSWTWTLDGKPRKAKPGPMLSGNSLVNNAAYRDELLKQYPDAIGGEMEGTGLYASAARKNKEWIVIKAICDWGARKAKDHQQLAASNAMSCLEAVLSEPGLEGSAFRRDALGHPAQDRLDATARSLVMLDVEKRVRAANDSKRAAVTNLASLITANTVSTPNGGPALSESGLTQVHIANAASNAETENWLNAYNDASSRYLAGDVDRAQFEATFGDEIVQILRIGGPHTRLLGNAAGPYASLHAAGANLLPKQVTGARARVLETFAEFKIGRSEYLPSQSLVAARASWDRADQDGMQSALDWLVKLGLLEDGKRGYVLTSAGYALAYAT